MNNILLIIIMVTVGLCGIIVALDFLCLRYHNTHLTNYVFKHTNYRFSFGVAFLGFLYPLFQWKYMRRERISYRYPTPGCVLFFSLLGPGIILGIIERNVTNTFVCILLTVIQMIIFGFIGARWKNRHLAVSDNNEFSIKMREIVATIFGFGLLICGLVFTTIDENETPASTNEVSIIVENGFVCDRYFNYSLEFSTTKQLRKEVSKIHAYCPNDIIWTQSWSVESVNATFPQLVSHDWNEDFIFTYSDDKNNTLYLYFKREN